MIRKFLRGIVPFMAGLVVSLILGWWFSQRRKKPVATEETWVVESHTPSDLPERIVLPLAAFGIEEPETHDAVISESAPINEAAETSLPDVDSSPKTPDAD